MQIEQKNVTVGEVCEGYLNDAEEGVTREGEYLSFAGDIYNSKKTTDRPGMFAATVKPYKWEGKDTWAVIDMTTDWVTDGGQD